MLGCVGNGERAHDDFLFRRGGEILRAVDFVQMKLLNGGPQQFRENFFAPVPIRIAIGADRLCAEQILRRQRVVIAGVEATQELSGRGIGTERSDRGEFCGRHAWRQGTPAVAIAEENQEIRPRRDPLAAGDFGKTDLQGLLIAACIGADAPAKIDGLEPGAKTSAQIVDGGKHDPPQRLTLGCEVGERGANEQSERRVGRDAVRSVAAGTRHSTPIVECLRRRPRLGAARSREPVTW